ncbi:MAG: dihydroneopterin aldolase [Vibrionaceae bacterium]
MDKVFIRQLEVVTHIGAYDWEQQIWQKLLLDIEMEFDIAQAAVSDDVSFALDYAKVAQAVTQFVGQGHFLLIERVAREVADLILQQFGVTWVRITVSKPSALLSAACAGVTIERRILR